MFRRNGEIVFSRAKNHCKAFSHNTMKIVIVFNAQNLTFYKFLMKPKIRN